MICIFSWLRMLSRASCWQRKWTRTWEFMHVCPRLQAARVKRTPRSSRHDDQKPCDDDAAWSHPSKVFLLRLIVDKTAVLRISSIPVYWSVILLCGYCLYWIPVLLTAHIRVFWQANATQQQKPSNKALQKKQTTRLTGAVIAGCFILQHICISTLHYDGRNHPTSSCNSQRGWQESHSRDSIQYVTTFKVAVSGKLWGGRDSSKILRRYPEPPT